MKPSLKPVNITLSPKEVVSLTGVIGTFMEVMKSLEVDVPIEIRVDMASLIHKMMDRVADQLDNEETN